MYFRYESTSLKSATANLPVLGSPTNTNENNPPSDPHIISAGSMERTKDERNREILQHQQSSSSNLERRLQRDSPVPKDDDGGSRGSGIEEI